MVFKLGNYEMDETKPAVPTSEMDKILEAIYRHRKLEAVKLYRQWKSCSLLEAKEFVEQLTERLKVESPDKFSANSKPVGCFGVLLMLIVVVTSIFL